MKKITLFLAAMAITLNAAATEYPVEYLDGLEFEWMGGDLFLPAPTGKTANAYYLGPVFIANTQDPDYDSTRSFDDVWLDIIKEDAYELNSNATNPSNTKHDDYEFAGFKAGYDDENIYIFIKYVDTEAVPLGTIIERMEIGVSPYVKLDAARTPTISGTPAPGLEYFRFIELGAYKIVTSWEGSVLSISTITVEFRGCAESTQANLGIDFADIVVDSHTPTNNSSEVSLIVTIPFVSLSNFMTGAGEFTYEDWLVVNDGKGISLDLKVNDVDGDDADLNTSRDYWWSCPPSLVEGMGDLSYYSTSSSGMLKAVPKGGVSTDNTNTQPGNIKVTSDKIIFNNPADVKIYSAASGALILNAANQTEVLTTGLGAGIYIVEADGEVAKFAK